MNVHAPGFAVAEQYRDRLVAAGVIDAEPEQLTISDAAQSSDGPEGLRTSGPTPDGGADKHPTGAPSGDQAPRPPARSTAISQSTNEEAPAVACSGDAGA